MELKLDHHLPALLGEFYEVTLNLKNSCPDDITDILVFFDFIEEVEEEEVGHESGLSLLRPELHSVTPVYVVNPEGEHSAVTSIKIDKVCYQPS